MPWKQKPFGWGKALSGETLFPPVQGATVAVLDQVEQIIRQDPSIQGITFKVDTVEPPSVELAIQSMLDRANSKLSFVCVASSVPNPNPRDSSAQKPLWKFSGGKPVAAIPKPSEALRDAVAKVVLASNDCMESWHQASGKASDFAIDQVESLLAVMVFPPRNVSDAEATDWVRRSQLAAAQLATIVEQNNGVSLADSKVADVINGPLDWSVDSAMVAMAQRAVEERELIDGVRSIVESVAGRVPSNGTWSCAAVAESVLKFLDATTFPSETSTDP